MSGVVSFSQFHRKLWCSVALAEGFKTIKATQNPQWTIIPNDVHTLMTSSGQIIGNGDWFCILSKNTMEKNGQSH